MSTVMEEDLKRWTQQGKAGMEDALRAEPEEVREQYERQRIMGTQLLFWKSENKCVPIVPFSRWLMSFRLQQANEKGAA